ncbi:peptidoglycan-binding protein [Streptomyces actinomycinicus]|uniref:Peptidoglycan-binding protein n=1 Tax=Streptomyces actinomycinicus TaxID=1695166 RepID=A0A937JM71_9ACTN|nr:peptidoglycan-binding domain-containing protein [Streptomyces actinomycinicus]MBL1080967.1 peptidoglycan-binding protein [Streptomyces actinomycinicus]
MSDSEGRTCPECGAPRGTDHSPSCDCTERAAEALRETRTAEAAAAEDFDPLRIRPYVGTPPEPETRSPETPDPTDTPPSGSKTPTPSDSTGTSTGLRDTSSSAGAGTGGRGASGPAGAGTEEGDAAWDAPLLTPDADERRPRRSRRSRRTALLVAGGAAAAVVAAAGFALVSYHTPTHDRAAQEVRERIPDTATLAPASATASAPPVAPRSSAASPSTPADPSPSRVSASPSPTPTPTASGSASGSASPTPSATASGTPLQTPAAAPVLRRGDTGPEVTELQQRLRQLNLYGDRIDGVFTARVEDAVRTYQLARGILGDTLGEYGPATRKSLETETTTPQTP